MSHRTYLNPHAAATVPAVGFAPESRRPAETHASMPGYSPTPLQDSPGLAQRLGVRQVLVKDESHRLGLPSFKILGASWAVLTTVVREWAPSHEGVLTLESVRTALGDPAGRGLIAATDGNHGRGVARMASLLGLASTILVPAGTTPARIRAISAEGASVKVIDGGYDQAVAASAAMADENLLVVSDTSWEGYEAPPRAVVEGYSTMFHEIDDALEAEALSSPTLVAVQAGVGAFAAAALRHYRTGVAGAPTTVIVEPTTANCLMASARAATPTEVPPPHPSTMAGLNCGLPSTLVWPVILSGADFFVSIDDAHAYDAMRALAAEGIEAGESGAAGLGGLLAVAEAGTADERTAAGLHADAVVLVVNTEGATDPDNYCAVLEAGVQHPPREPARAGSHIDGGAR